MERIFLRSFVQWIEHPNSSYYTVIEDSVHAGTGVVVTMLWWKDERQILDLSKEDEDEGAETPLSGHLSFRPRGR